MVDETLILRKLSELDEYFNQILLFTIMIKSMRKLSLVY